MLERFTKRDWGDCAYCYESKVVPPGAVQKTIDRKRVSESRLHAADGGKLLPGHRCSWPLKNPAKKGGPSVTAETLLSDLGIAEPRADQSLFAEAAASGDTGWQRALENLAATVRSGGTVHIEIKNEQVAREFADKLQGIASEPWVKTDFAKLEAERIAAKPVYPSGLHPAPEEDEYPKSEPKSWANSSPIERKIRGFVDPNAKRRSAIALLAKLGH